MKLFNNLQAAFNSIKLYLNNFFKYNLIALQINPQYRFHNIFLLILTIAFISSIFLRLGFIDLKIFLLSDLSILLLLYYIIIIMSILFCYKIIFDIIKRIIQAIEMLPFFIKYINKLYNIEKIMIYYYIQSIIIIILSSYFLYLII